MVIPYTEGAKTYLHVTLDHLFKMSIHFGTLCIQDPIRDSRASKNGNGESECGKVRLTNMKGAAEEASTPMPALYSKQQGSFGEKI